MKRLAFLFVLAAAALPARAQDHAVAGGADLSAGILGVTYIRHVEGDWWGFAVGAGVTGPGVRVQRRLYEEGDADGGFRTRYLSAGLALPLFLRGQIDAPVLLSVEYGTEIVYKPLYASLAVGGLVPIGGDIGGNTLGPSIRLVFGYAY